MTGGAKGRGKNRGRPKGTGNERAPAPGPEAKRARRGSGGSQPPKSKAASHAAASVASGGSVVLNARPGAPASAAGSHRSRSPAGRSTAPARSPEEKLLASIKKYREALSFKRVLAEELHQDMHQARRALDAVAGKESLAAEWVGFQSFMNERELALSLAADSYHKLSRTQRREKLAEFAPVLGEEEPPQTWGVAVLGGHVRDCLDDVVQKKDERSVTVLVEAMLPFGGRGRQ